MPNSWRRVRRASHGWRGSRGSGQIVGFRPGSDTIPIAAFVGLPHDQVLAPIGRATAVSVVAMAAGALAAFLLAWLFGRYFIYRPVLTILDTIRAWRGGERTARTGAGPTAPNSA
jgi:hypothetical protein